MSFPLSLLTVPGSLVGSHCYTRKPDGQLCQLKIIWTIANETLAQIHPVCQLNQTIIIVSNWLLCSLLFILSLIIEKWLPIQSYFVKSTIFYCWCLLFYMPCQRQQIIKNGHSTSSRPCTPIPTTNVFLTNFFNSLFTFQCMFYIVFVWHLRFEIEI